MASLFLCGDCLPGFGCFEDKGERHGACRFTTCCALLQQAIAVQWVYKLTTFTWRRRSGALARLERAKAYELTVLSGRNNSRHGYWLGSCYKHNWPLQRLGVTNGYHNRAIQKPTTRTDLSQSRLSRFSLSTGVTFTPRLGPLPNLRGLIESSPVASRTGLVGAAWGGVNRPPAFPALLRPKRFLLGLPPSQVLLPDSATLLSTVAGVAAR